MYKPASAPTTENDPAKINPTPNLNSALAATNRLTQVSSPFTPRNNFTPKKNKTALAMKANVGRIANILPIFAFNNSNTAYTTAKITGSKKAKNKPTLKSVLPTFTVIEPNAPVFVFWL